MNQTDSNGIKLPASEMSSHDFSSMYTTSEHPMIIELLNEYIDLVFDHEKEKDPNRQILLLKDNGKSFDWTNTKDTDTRTTQNFDANKLKQWIKLHIDNLFVVA